MAKTLSDKKAGIPQEQTTKEALEILCEPCKAALAEVMQNTMDQVKQC